GAGRAGQANARAAPDLRDGGRTGALCPRRGAPALPAAAARAGHSMSRSQLLDLLREAPAYQAAHAGYVSQGVADVEPFPFLAIVGQEEMKLALVLAVINPAVGGVLLLGPRGTGKTTAVRSLVDLLPSRVISLCENGCTEAMLEAGGMGAICKECAQKTGYGEPLSREERVGIVNLPLNARLEDVVGGIDERLALEQQRVRLERGLL